MLDRAFVFTNRCFLIGLCLGSIALAKQTFADNQDGLYIGFALAPQLFSDNKAGEATIEFDTGIAFSGLIGYKLSNLRLEGELAYQTVEGTNTSRTDVNADVNIVRFTGAAYYDFELFSLRPYLGGGMGVASLDTSGGFENNDSAFTWHGEAGLTFNLTDQFAILPSYRYEWTDTDIGRFDKAQTAHAFRITLRYQFQPVSQIRSVREEGYDYRYNPRPSYPYYPRYGHDPYYNRHHHPPPHPKKPEPTKTPEQRERDRCGWEGPGCR
jgi:opacity protein-like surface antigen